MIDPCPFSVDSPMAAMSIQRSVAAIPFQVFCLIRRPAVHRWKQFLCSKNYLILPEPDDDFGYRVQLQAIHISRIGVIL